eukprot:5572058-Pleurochrysis_carterae.AAC.1
MATLAAEAARPPPQDVVGEVRSLVSHADNGDAAWAALFSIGKYTGALPGEGVLSATVVVAREHLLSLARTRVVSIVGEEWLTPGVLAGGGRPTGRLHPH